jgi:CMP-N-acetylneuraminic acid synthetase
MVSTDGFEIASIASDLGTLVPWLRPAELATDEAKSADVAIHALDWYESHYGLIDGLVLLQPTSPFRTRVTIEEGIRLFKKFGQQPVLAVSSIENPVDNSYVEIGEFLHPFLKSGESSTYELLHSKFYIPNGVLYIVSPSYLRGKQSFAFDQAVPLCITSELESIDIDTLEDWKLAQAVASSMNI